MLNNKNRIAIIGAGVSGLSAACIAAKFGYQVDVYEKNPDIGGRARVFQENGFLFDMGPSWYWMPDVFEKFFGRFDRSSNDFYSLKQLDPGFQLFFEGGTVLPVPAKKEELYEVFERFEPGSSAKLKKFLGEGRFKYQIAMKELVYKPALSWMEFMNYEVINGMVRSHLFRSVRSYVRSYFKNPHLIALMEFPVLFLGAMPQHIPALYSLMNFAALELGTWYPMGGMHQIVTSMQEIALLRGVEFINSCEVESILVNKQRAVELNTTRGSFSMDALVASADYHHIEQKLLNEAYRNYSEQYWETKTFAPSCLIFYVGVNKKIKKLIHHNLFFDTDFEKHSKEIYEYPKWPDNPLFYVCCPSKTDPTVAPEGMENLFILTPVATGLTDTPEERERYFALLIKRMEAICGEPILSHICYKKSYCINDFIKDYNAYKGNAYGLANTLRQTAVLKPSIRNKKVSNIFYTGQLTVPGPGLPPAIISGEIAATRAYHYLKTSSHETTV